jgi:hypothetical protein
MAGRFDRKAPGQTRVETEDGKLMALTLHTQTVL